MYSYSRFLIKGVSVFGHLKLVCSGFLKAVKLPRFYHQRFAPSYVNLDKTVFLSRFCFHCLLLLLIYFSNLVFIANRPIVLTSLSSLPPLFTSFLCKVHLNTPIYTYQFRNVVVHLFFVEKYVFVMCCWGLFLYLTNHPLGHRHFDSWY